MDIIVKMIVVISKRGYIMTVKRHNLTISQRVNIISNGGYYLCELIENGDAQSLAV